MEVRGQLSGVESVLALFTWIRGKTQGPQTILSHLPGPHKLGHIFCLHMLCLITGLVISLSPSYLFWLFSVFFWLCVGGEISLYMEWWLMPVTAHVLTSEDNLGYHASLSPCLRPCSLSCVCQACSPFSLQVLSHLIGELGLHTWLCLTFCEFWGSALAWQGVYSLPRLWLSVSLFRFTSFIELTLSLGFAVFIIALVCRIHLTQCKTLLPLRVGFCHASLLAAVDTPGTTLLCVNFTFKRHKYAIIKTNLLGGDGAHL